MNFRLIDSGWDTEFDDAAANCHDELFIVTPFLQLSAVQHLFSGRPRKVSVITRFALEDLYAGVSSTDALSWLLEQGAEIKGVRNLHAKAYIFDDKRAFVTSANLTWAALIRNHELGFVTTDGTVVRECRAYFTRLWEKASGPLSRSELENWKSQIDTTRSAGGQPQSRDKLGDFGANLDISPHLPPDIHFEIGSQALVKFFGRSGERISRTLSVFEEVRDSGSHWACNYPASIPPARVEEGATIFLSHLVGEPDDIVVYGRAVALAHDRVRDRATPEEIEARPWKKDWPLYLRIRDATFVNGTLQNGIPLSELMDALRHDSFASTQSNFHANAEDGGTRNTNPRMAFRQRPDVMLTREGALWLNTRLEQAFANHGTIPGTPLDTLDWPTPRNARPDDGLSEQARNLLRLLVARFREPWFALADRRTYYGYEEALVALGFTPQPGRIGPQLLPRGLEDLAFWIRDRGLPAITGLIVNKSGQREGLPGGDYFEVYGQPDGAEDWWRDELRQAKLFDWTPFL